MHLQQISSYIKDPHKFDAVSIGIYSWQLTGKWLLLTIKVREYFDWFLFYIFYCSNEQRKYNFLGLAMFKWTGA